MKVFGVAGVPDYEVLSFEEKSSEYCLLVPVLNEAGRIEKELERGRRFGVDKAADIIILDGGSNDGGVGCDMLKEFGVNALLTKTGPGRQGAQLRMGFHFALERGYCGFVTVDGNNKDSIEDVPAFIEKLKEGYGFVQGSRYIKGGTAENTPFYRHIAVRCLHAPLISKAAGFKYTDTTNAFRAYSREYISDEITDIFRDVFSGYELLAYLSVRATQTGYKAIEIPAARRYPKNQKTPTKISPISGSAELLRILVNTVRGKYRP